MQSPRNILVANACTVSRCLFGTESIRGRLLREAFFLGGAPGRAHSLGRGSPLLARQGEGLAERQGCSGRLEIWRKPKAKRWPDEQGADMRRHGGVRRPISSKRETCTERRDVNPTGISVKVSASYPGRSGGLPCATGIERCRDGQPEVSRGHSSCQQGATGRTLKAASRRREHTESR